MFAQTRLTGVSQNDINPSLLQGRWKARWIFVPDEAANTYGVYHFRKSFSLDTLPERFLVHVTADNRYKLFLNGTMVSLGPARGDVYNWSYETVDLSPWLRKGVNVLAAVVLIPHRKGDANMRAVWLFSRNDAIGNLAVVAAAALVWWLNSPWPDLLMAFVVAALFLQSAWSIIRDARQDLAQAGRS